MWNHHTIPGLKISFRVGTIIYSVKRNCQLSPLHSTASVREDLQDSQPKGSWQEIVAPSRWNREFLTRESSFKLLWAVGTYVNNLEAIQPKKLSCDILMKFALSLERFNRAAPSHKQSLIHCGDKSYRSWKENCEVTKFWENERNIVVRLFIDINL